MNKTLRNQLEQIPNEEVLELWSPVHHVIRKIYNDAQIIVIATIGPSDPQHQLLLSEFVGSNLLVAVIENDSRNSSGIAHLIHSLSCGGDKPIFCFIIGQALSSFSAGLVKCDQFQSELKIQSMHIPDLSEAIVLIKCTCTLATSISDLKQVVTRCEELRRSITYSPSLVNGDYNRIAIFLNLDRKDDLYASIKNLIDTYESHKLRLNIDFYMNHNKAPIINNKLFNIHRTVFCNWRSEEDLNLLRQLNSDAIGWQRIQYFSVRTFSNSSSALHIPLFKNTAEIPQHQKSSETNAKCIEICVKYACEALIACAHQMNAMNAGDGRIGDAFKMVSQRILNDLETHRIDGHQPQHLFRRISWLAEVYLEEQQNHSNWLGATYAILCDCIAQAFSRTSTEQVFSLGHWLNSLQIGIAKVLKFATEEQFQVIEPLSVFICVARDKLENSSDYIVLWSAPVAVVYSTASTMQSWTSGTVGYVSTSISIWI